MLDVEFQFTMKYCSLIENDKVFYKYYTTKIFQIIKIILLIWSPQQQNPSFNNQIFYACLSNFYGI